MEQFQVSRHFAKIVIAIHAVFMAVVVLSNIFGADPSRPPAINSTISDPAETSAVQAVGTTGKGTIVPVAAYTTRRATTVYRVGTTLAASDMQFVSSGVDGKVRVSDNIGHGKFVVQFSAR